MSRDQKTIGKLLFYTFLKKLVGQESKLSSRQVNKLLEGLDKNSNLGVLETQFSKLNLAKNKEVKYTALFDAFNSNESIAQEFRLALLFLRFKKRIFDRMNTQKNMLGSLSEGSKSIDNPAYKLTSEYDVFSALEPYQKRVNAVSSMYELYTSEFEVGLAVEEYLPYFQIQLDESLKQSGISRSGNDYENRIAELFDFFNLEYERHQHEKADSSQEHDFIVKYKDHIIGIGAKRTLRERYKQYNPNEVHYSIVFTMGEDLTESIASTITDSYKSLIFVADEIYDAREYLQLNCDIHKVSNFSKDILDDLICGSKKNEN